MWQMGTAFNRGPSIPPNIFLLKQFWSHFDAVVVSTHTTSIHNTIGSYSLSLLLETARCGLRTMDKACHLCSSFLETLLFRKTKLSTAIWHSFVVLLFWKPKFNFAYFRLMYKWQCFVKRKKNCAVLLLQAERIIGVHILNRILQLSGSCLPAGILLHNVWAVCMVIFNQDIRTSTRLLI